MLLLFEHIFIIIPYSLYSKSSSSLFPFNLHPTVQNPVWENVTGVLVTPSGAPHDYVRPPRNEQFFVPQMY
jgi:hypothetical protein